MNTTNTINQLILQQDNTIINIKKNIKIANDDLKPLFVKQLKMFESIKKILTMTVEYLTNKINKEIFNEFIINMMNDYTIILSDYLEVLVELVQKNIINENQYIEYCNDVKKEKGLMDMVLYICTIMKNN